MSFEDENRDGEAAIANSPAWYPAASNSISSGSCFRAADTMRSLAMRTSTDSPPEIMTTGAGFAELHGIRVFFTAMAPAYRGGPTWPAWRTGTRHLIPCPPDTCDPC
jgi:hypothetical protein